MSPRKLFAAFSTAALLLSACPAMAAAAQNQMQEVVVTADRTEELARTVTRQVTVIDRDEIEKSKFTNLTQVLQHHALIPTSRGNQPLDQIQIRGMKNLDQGNSIGGNVLLMIDGHIAGSSFISSIPLVSVERIEVLHGPASVQYGSSALGGVVNVITKRGGKDFHASIEAGLGSWAQTKTEAGLSGSYGIFDFAGGVALRTQDDDYNTGRGQYQNTDLHHRTDYAVNVGITPFEEHRLGFVAVGSTTKHSGSPYYYDGIEMNNKTPYDYSNRESHSLDVNYNGGYKDYGLNWKARYYHTRDNYSFYARNIEYDPAFNPIRYLDGYDYVNRAKERNNGVQAQLSWKYDFLSLTGGFDWLDNKYQANSGEPTATLKDSAGFLMGKASLLDEMLIFSAGVRYDSYSMRFEGNKTDDSKTTYSFGLAYNPWDWLTFRANYGTSFKMPSGMAVAGYSGGWNPVLANKNLNPEEGKGWDIGAEANWQGLTAGITYFQTDYKNQIYLNSAASQYQNRNGTARYRGIEAKASYDVAQAFDWNFVLKPYVNMTHLFTYKDQTGEKLQDVRSTIVAYGLNFNMQSIGLAMDFRVTYFGHQHETHYNDDYSTETIKTGGFSTADIFLTKSLYEWEKAGKLSLNASVTNIGDKYYALKDRYPMPGRAFYIGLKYDY